MAVNTESYFSTNNGGVRGNNEDGLLVKDILITDTSMETTDSFLTDDTDALFCVADGIGGEQKGEVASHKVLCGLLAEQAIITSEKTVSDALYLAKENLEQYVKENPDAYNLGCTLAGLIIRGTNAIAFNVGDCRVYRINGNYFEQITKDHSIVQTLFDEGIITEEEMRFHPRRNVITSSVSGDGRSDSIQVYSHEISLRNYDIFFICSDGIWGCFSHDELEMIYQRFQGYEFCEKLLTAALARRASDNISGILLIVSTCE